MPEIFIKSFVLRKSIDRLIYLFICMCVFFMLQYYYKYFCGFFGYFGLDYRPRDQWHYLLALTLVLLTALQIPLRYTKPSDLFLNIFFLFIVIPSAVLYTGDKLNFEWAFIVLIVWFNLIVLFMKFSFLQFHVHQNALNKRSFILFILMLLGFCIAILIAKFGFTFRFISLENVYTLRSAFKEEASRMLIYVFNWSGYILGTALFIFALYNRKYLLLIMSLILQYYLFSLGGHKSILFIIPYCYAIYLLLKWFSNQFAVVLSGGLLLAIMLLFVSDQFIGHLNLASSMFIHRGLIMPAQLYYDYIDFFTKNPVDYFAQSFPFNLIYQTHYNQKIQNIIGDLYVSNGRHIFANVNFLADMYANIGLWSQFLAFVFFGGILVIYDRLAYGRNVLFVAPLLAVSLITLMNGGFIVNLVTHGILLLILVVFLSPKVNTVQLER